MCARLHWLALTAQPRNRETAGIHHHLSATVKKDFHMTVWPIRPVNDQPTLTLERWSIYELPDGDRHFVGWAIENLAGRVSSRIDEFNVKTMYGLSASGRVYQLKGPPGRNRDAEHTWNLWRGTNNVETFVEVSDTVWATHKCVVA